MLRDGSVEFGKSDNSNQRTLALRVEAGARLPSGVGSCRLGRLNDGYTCRDVEEQKAKGSRAPYARQNVRNLELSPTRSTRP